MKKIFWTLVAIVLFTACRVDKPVLTSYEYTIVDTIYTSKNVFNTVLFYDVVLLNHYDSMYHAGTISPSGELIVYNPRPVKIKFTR